MTLDYIAGLVDGEGHIGLRFAAGGSPRKAQIEFQIANTSLALVQSVRDFMGVGTIIKPNMKNPKHRQVWVYKAYSNNAYLALKVISPLLILKKPQADLAIEFVEKHIRGRERRGNRLTDVEITDRLAYKDMFSKLNKRGT